MPASPAVLSFMSQWGGGAHLQKHNRSTSASPAPTSPPPKQQPSTTPAAYAQSATALDSYNQGRASPSPAHHERSDSRLSSRPMSMIQTYQPPVMEVGQDTLPELQRIFTFLNSHSNKLYQEGYFLKFHDTDARMLSPSISLTNNHNSNIVQAVDLLPIESGKSTLSNWLARSSRFGMRVNWIKPGVMLKCYPHSSTLQMLLSTWYVYSCGASEYESLISHRYLL